MRRAEERRAAILDQQEDGGPGVGSQVYIDVYRWTYIYIYINMCVRFSLGKFQVRSFPFCKPYIAVNVVVLDFICSCGTGFSKKKTYKPCGHLGLYSTPSTAFRLHTIHISPRRPSTDSWSTRPRRTATCGYGTVHGFWLLGSRAQGSWVLGLTVYGRGLGFFRSEA